MANRRQTLITLGAGAILVVAIGVLWAINGGPGPEDYRIDLAGRIEELNRIPDQDAVRKLALAEELVRNESYRKYALSLLVKVDRALPKLQQAAQLERAANKEVPPFLARCKDLKCIPRAELSILHGEARSLLGNYRTTRQGPALEKIVASLKQAVDAIPLCTSQDLLELSRNVQIMIRAGRFAQAHAALVDFEKKYDNADEFKTQLAELRATILRQAKARLEADPEPLRRLESGDFKGLPLQDFVRGLTKP